MGIQAISTALADVLEDLNINLYDYGPDAMQPPAAYIYPENVQFNVVAPTGVDEATWIIRILAASTNTQGGQTQLNDLIDAAVPAISDANTLNDVVQSAIVREMRNYGVLQLPDTTRYYAADLVVGILV